MNDTTKNINKVLSFVLELVMLAGFCYWGFHFGKALWLRVTLGIGIPILAMLFWATFLGPKARLRLKMVAGSFFSALLFMLAAAALYCAAQQFVAVAFALAIAGNFILKLEWKQW